jgi:hypothetical protein
MKLPPLLKSHPPALQAALVVIPAVAWGFFTGATLGMSVAAWVIANAVAAIGGVGGGFDHDGAREGAKRGALGGLVFGLFLVLADATVVDDRVASIAKPAILQAVVTTFFGVLLGALGGHLRGRVERRTAEAQPALATSTTPNP